MATYMRDMRMPWPAVRFEKVAEKEQLLKYAGPGIPCLVVIDAEGRVVSNTYEGTQFRGPTKVLTDLDKMWGAPPAPVALQR